MTLTLRATPAYAGLLRRYNALDAILYPTWHERAEKRAISERLEAMEMAYERREGERRDAGAVSAFQTITTDYEYLLSMGDYGGIEG